MGPWERLESMWRCAVAQAREAKSADAPMYTIMGRVRGGGRVSVWEQTRRPGSSMSW